MNTTSSDVAEAVRYIHSYDAKKIESPSTNQKRASVAIVISFATVDRLPIGEQSDDLETFLRSEAVKAATPHFLFIKRAARQGDRWASHVALPGGKVDTHDISDEAAARRETLEEVGLVIDDNTSFYVGELDQRSIATDFGLTFLMVLSPFVYVMRDPPRPLKIQESEVASAHWVPISSILDPANRAKHYVHIGERFHKNPNIAGRWFWQALLGQMEFSAIRLVPSFSTPICGDYSNLLMWGITLGCLTDVMDLIPPRTGRKLWKFPTFTQLDTRFFLYLCTIGVRGSARNNILQSEMNWTGRFVRRYYRKVPQALYLTFFLRFGLFVGVLLYLYRTQVAKRRIRFHISC